MSRTTRGELYVLLSKLEGITRYGLGTLRLDCHSPGDGWTRYVIEDHSHRRVFGERLRTAGELADCMRFALAVYEYDHTKQNVGEPP